MASTSGQQVNLNGSYRRWLAETFDGHETTDDELSDNLEGQNNIAQPIIHNLPTALEPWEPYIGMEFQSAEDAREFYEMYGRRMGFTIRNNRTRRSLKDNSIIGREYVCSKEGFRARKNRAFSSRPAFREGCNALLRIAAKDGGKWVIYGFTKEHSHELKPTAIPHRRAHRIAFSEMYIRISSYKHYYHLDKKDLKIRELSTELHCEKKKSAAYQEQLKTVLKYIEEHTQQLSLKIDAMSGKLRELETEETNSSDSD